MGAGHEKQAVGGFALRGHDGLQLTGAGVAAGEADGDLQSGGAEPREGVVRLPGVHGGGGRAGDVAVAGGRADTGHGEGVPDLPGVHVGVVRVGAGGAPKGDHAVLSPLAVWGGEAVRVLDYEELPGGVRDVRRERDSFQPRERAAGRDVRDPENHNRRLPYRTGVPGQAVPGEPGRPAGLGICEGLCGVHVADPAARHAGGFCHRHGGIPHGAGVHDAGVQGGGDRVAVGGERPGGAGR